MAEGPGREWRDFRVYFIQGCRQNGMAGAGYSLPNDENLLLLNPAGLGIKNKRFENFAISYGNSFEPQTNWYKDIPVFQDHYLSFCFQRPKNYVGGFSALADIYPLIMQGEIAGSEWDPVSQTIIPIGDTLSDKRIYISSIFGYGRDLSFINLKNHSVGISAIVMGYHATNFGEPITDGSIELTIGYASKFFKDFHFGFVFSNIPIVKSFYSDREKATLLKIIPSFGFNRVLKRENKIDAIKLFAEVNYKLTIEEVSSGDLLVK